MSSNEIGGNRGDFRQRVELLAPAGNWDCARAAVASGADAIYFGMPKFNARLRADNFTEEDLPEVMEFLHGHSVRGFVTMNTLVFADELAAAEAQLRSLDAAGVDAIIVQDLGLAKLARSVAPDLELHASTQMTITAPEGLKLIDQLVGLDRAVLARELSLREIKKFSPQEGVPLEVFVHGALCVAYSGQCLTSESLGQRSANRGECAQACRMPYQLVVDGETLDLGEQRYLLSPQDLAAVDVIDELVNLGVMSFKIEGRLKTPEYVSAVTSVYRKALDAAVAGRRASEVVTDRDRYEMEMTFSRGLSTGWLEGTNHPRLTHGKFGKKRGAWVGDVVAVGENWVELSKLPAFELRVGQGVVFDAGEDRNKEQGGRITRVDGRKLGFNLKHSRLDFRKVKVGQGVWLTDDPQLNAELRKRWRQADLRVPRQTLDFLVEGEVGEPLCVTERGSGAQVRSRMPLVAAVNRPLDTITLRKQLGRLGDSGFELGAVENTLPGDVILPLSELNRLRRRLVARLSELSDTGGQNGNTRRTEIGAERSYLDLMPRLSDSDEAKTHKGSKSILEGQKLSVLVRNFEQLESVLEVGGVDRIYVDFEDIRRGREAVELQRSVLGQHSSELFLATPRIQKAGESGYFKVLERAEPDGILLRNLGAISYFRAQSGVFGHDRGLKVVGDFSLNVANPISARLLIESFGFINLTASYDLNASQLKDLLEACPVGWFELTLHQHMPMFHMEHCVFCAFMSDGKDYRDCGRPCEKHKVHLRDRVGQLHPLVADVGCRNTLFNGRAQTGARFYQSFLAAGARHFRVELVNESGEDAKQIVKAYQALLRGEKEAEGLWRELGAIEKLGVTEGNLL